MRQMTFCCAHGMLGCLHGMVKLHEIAAVIVKVQAK